MLIAADAYLIKKNVLIIKSKGKRKHVEDYKKALAQINKKLLNHFNTAYHVLHLDGYYDGVLNVKIINEGFELAQTIINFAKNR